MNTEKDSYKKELDSFMKEEYSKEPQKPNGMFGHWGWYAVKKRKFDRIYNENRTTIRKLEERRED